MQDPPGQCIVVKSPATAARVDISNAADCLGTRMFGGSDPTDLTGDEDKDGAMSARDV